MKMSEMFPSKYLKAADIERGRERQLTTDYVDVELMESTGDKKPVLYFKGEDRGLVLNRTNAEVLSDAFGEDSDDWAGQRVVLYCAKTQFAGKTCDGLRLRPAVNGQAEAAPKPMDPADTNVELQQEAEESFS
ncbi:MAG: hypothetical protein HQ567_06670 [Candidatus Nealsonbacteria bacterium]|nr:hypothetical protein [Candidatus Nealsonbacteria bacterium]